MSNSLAVRFGRTIRAAREARGVSQERFAATIGRHRTFMGTLERGETNPSLDTMERVAVALRMPLWQLLKDADERLDDDFYQERRGPVARVAESRKPAGKGTRRR